MDSTHTHVTKNGGEMFPVSQTELLPVVSENAQKTQKNTEKSSKKVQETECGITFPPLFFFFLAKILKASQTHKSKRPTQSPNTVVQLKS